MKPQRHTDDPRVLHLEQTRKALVSALAQGVTGEQVPCQADYIAGPRAGAVLLQVGLAAGKVLRFLSGDNAALARQFISWGFPGDPGVFMSGRLVRVEAPWPDSLAQTEIRFRDVGQHPRGGGRWVAGLDERGVTIVMGFSDNVPHILMGGTSGSGKTVAIRNAAVQLSRQAAEVVLVALDGKFGAGLGPLTNLPGMAGPVATDMRQAANALGWVNAELQRRYTLITTQGERAVAALPRIVVLFDEFQEFMADAGVRELTRRVLAQGRAARIHAVLATQHPTVDAFGEDGSLKRNLVGRVALRVTDQDASRVVVGDSTPQANRLMGKGDAYTIIPGHIHRVQLLLVDAAEIEALPHQEAPLREWPEVRPADYGEEPTVNWAYSGAELAWGLIGAAQTPPWGRKLLTEALEDAGLDKPGSERADRLRDLTHETFEHLRSADYGLVHLADADTEPIVLQEMGLGLAAATNDWSRRQLQAAFVAAQLATPGSTRADRVRDLGDDMLDFLRAAGYQVAITSEACADAAAAATPFSPAEMAAALLTAVNGQGRPRLLQALEEAELPRPGAERARQLLAFGRQLRDKLAEADCTVQIGDAEDAGLGDEEAD